MWFLLIVYRFSHIFWIDASSIDTIMLSLRGLLNSSASSASNETSQSALQWMAQLPGEWIIVFDNADGAPEVVEKFIPPGHMGNVLVTSRNRSMGSLTRFENSLEIDNMEKKEAISLLLKASGYKKADTSPLEMAQKIVTELCCLPLAIAQAGASIEAGLCSINDYLDLYIEKRKELLFHPFFRGVKEYKQTVYGTWELLFKEIESRAARDSDSDDVQSAQIAILILQIFAFMHYESIDESIFGHAAEELYMLHVSNQRSQLSQILASNADKRLFCCNKSGKWDKWHFRGGIQTLQSFSLIKRSPSENIYSVHPLVHSWSRDRLFYSEQQKNFHRATTILSSSITFSSETQDYIIRRKLIPHIKACYQYATEIGIQKKYDDTMYSKFGLVFRENGDWTEAENVYSQMMKERIKMFGQEHPKTLNCMANLAFTYRNQGKWSEAEKLEIRVLDMNKKVLGQKHQNTLISMANLASIYKNQGRWNEAEQLQIQALDMIKSILGEEHPDTLVSMVNLALTYRNQGRWNKAEQLQTQVLDVMKRVHGQEHPNTLTTMANLASTYRNQGKWNEAEKLEIKVLDMKKRVLGQEHPDTLISMANLASTYKDEGRWNEAVQLQIQVLNISKKILGQEHPNTLINTANLAATYRNQGKWTKAEQLVN